MTRPRRGADAQTTITAFQVGPRSPPALMLRRTALALANTYPTAIRRALIPPRVPCDVSRPAPPPRPPSRCSASPRSQCHEQPPIATITTFPTTSPPHHLPFFPASLRLLALSAFPIRPSLSLQVQRRLTHSASCPSVSSHSLPCRTCTGRPPVHST